MRDKLGNSESKALVQNTLVVRRHDVGLITIRDEASIEILREVVSCLGVGAALAGALRSAGRHSTRVIESS